MAISNLSTSRRVTCAVPSCKHSGHILIEHVIEAHKLTPSQYLAQYPDAPLYSALGQRKLAEQFSASTITPVQRKTERVKVKDVFGPHLKSTEQITRYVEPGPFTMEADKTYVFPERQTMYLLMALERATRNAVAIVGKAGTGKTQLVINALSLLNYGLFRLQGDSYQGRSEQIGEWKVIGNHMEFVYGILPRAMKLGEKLLIDEWDCLNPHVMNILRPVMEQNPRLVIQENGGEVVEAAPGFQIIATGNTWGYGDTSGLYGTTAVMSAADRQRFSFYIALDYLSSAVEEKILRTKFPNLDPKEAEAFVKVANEVRQKHKEGKVDEAISPRQLVNWCDTYLELGDVEEAADLTLLNAMPPEVGVAVREIINRAFPKN